MNFDIAIEEDKRGFCKMLLSMIKNNNTILFVILCDNNNFFIKASVIILSFNLYIFINILFMFNSSSLHLYIDRDYDLKEKLEAKYFFINIMIPFLIYIPTCIFKKIISIKEFMYDISYKLHKNENNEKLKENGYNSIKKDLEFFISKTEKHSKWLFIVGIIFLFFNWYFVTCFCGIYENSIDCLILNIFVSLIFSLIFSLGLFIFSSGLRFYGISNKNILIYYISALFNPTYLMYGNKILEKVKNQEEVEKNE